jgi:hypothetical protein
MPQESSNYPTMKYPLASDPVNVHGDFKVLVDALNNILPPLGYHATQVLVRNITGLDLAVGTPVSISGSVAGQITVEKYNPSNPSYDPLSSILGLVKGTDNLQNPNPARIPNLENGIVVTSGFLKMNTTEFGGTGTKIYVNNAGDLVSQRPSTGNFRCVAVVALPGTNGMVIVNPKGNGTWGALKDGLS